MHGSKQVNLDRSFTRPQDLRDLSQIHVLDEAEQEYQALLFRKVFRRFPNRLNLLPENRLSLWRGFMVRNAVQRISSIARQGLRAPPELQPAISSLIADQVCGDLHEPRFDRGIPAKAVSVPKRAQQAVLGETLGGITVTQRGEQKSKYRRLIELDYAVEVPNFHVRPLQAGRNQF
jgi:hypothetical protein